MKCRSEMKVVMFSLFICCLLVTLSQGKWPEGCRRLENIIHEEHCYKTFLTKMNYNIAVGTCLEHGGTIAKMKNSLIQALIVADFRKKDYPVYFWAGVNDLRSEGTFQYDNGSLLSPFIPWATDQPDNGRPNRHYGYRSSGDEDCVVVKATEQWIDEKCDTQSYFACEFKKDHSDCNIQELNIPHSEYKSCYTSDKLTYGEFLPIKCKEGYVLVGSNNVTCLADSEWSPQPHCVQGCPPPRVLQHGTFLNLKDVHTIGSQVTYVCNDGYVTNRQQRSHSKISCGPNGKWLPGNSGCSLEEKYTIGTMEVESDTSISIPCITFNTENSTGNEILTDDTTPYLWLKNSKNINDTKLDYSIDVNGTLTINHISKDAVGQYICFQNDQHLTPALMGFDLKLKPEVCPLPGNQTEQLELKEGDPFVLTCPHSSTEHDFTWFKDGHRYYVRSDQTLFPDGTLHTKSLQYTDQGLYTCRMLVKETLCELNYTTRITIQVSPANICGKIEPEYPHPWAVYLWKKDEIAPFCYGTLINERWVVTSANCLAGFNRKRKLNLFVRFGYRESDSTRNEIVTETEVHTVKIHPKFSKKLYVNDVGLVQLKQPVRFTRSIRPICLTDNDLTIKQPCDRSPPIKGTVVGWGPLEKDDYDEFPPMLNETMSIVATRHSCFSTDHSYFDQILCTKKTDGTRTTLAGDAGSTLEVLWKERYYLLGVYSWGERSALLGEHDYFTKINGYVSWLNGFNVGINPESL